ncbi:MAG: sigma-54 dependent transcriptional regulator [Spirochaetales bacterium]|jgi:DNA-binding NtrC family response regulator|nr:sigma-54 dependent transcriptional regulator [Spirochaetales bacterium]
MPASARPSILAVDDDPILTEFLRILLEAHGYERLKICADDRDVMGLLAREKFDLVLLDLHLPHISGRTLLQTIHEIYPDIPVVIITVEDTVDVAVECMKAGAFDFLLKPVSESRLLPTIRHATTIRELQSRVHQLERTHNWELNHPEAFQEIITVSDVMRSIFAYIEAIRASSKAVLVTGESGTGKELIAQIIHKVSGRPGRFVPVNVSGLDDTLFSDTLFGHVKGAFSGADSVRKGFIEQAAEGTLFLDEIGDLEPVSQIKLLRLLQEGEFYPLGTDTPGRCRARIIAATNADLKAKQLDKSFRPDLYYRLMAHHIELPPLRDRPEDLSPLVGHFVTEAAAQLSKQPPEIPKDLVSLLSAYHFPGNIRELSSLLYDAVSRNDSGRLDSNFFKDYIDKHGKEAEIPAAASPALSLLRTDRLPTLQEAEDMLIREALRVSGGNQSAAARLIGVSQSTLSRRQKEIETAREPDET